MHTAQPSNDVQNQLATAKVRGNKLSAPDAVSKGLLGMHRTNKDTAEHSDKNNHNQLRWDPVRLVTGEGRP